MLKTINARKELNINGLLSHKEKQVRNHKRVK
jgi:hypothetical protein